MVNHPYIIAADGKPWPETTDGRVWAQMWIQRLEATYQQQAPAGTLSSWFANAIMAAWDAAIAAHATQGPLKEP